jgi:type VI secretion system protein ImpG
MPDDLQYYYEQELAYLRQMGAQFKEKYPKAASRLMLEPAQCEDPHVERLLEAFAFLAARVHLKIDDEFPEITEALLGIVYPHLTRPVPSMSVVEFRLDLEQGKLSTGLPIPRDSVLRSRPGTSVDCTFRTCYDTTLWPISVSVAEWKTPDRLLPAIKASDYAGALRLELRCAPDVTFPQLQIDRLRFYLSGDDALVHSLYELLCCKLNRVVIRDPSPATRVKPVTLGASCFHPIGFAEDEAVLSYPRQSFVGYRLLQEYFTFPYKFFFVDITGLDSVWSGGFKGRAELVFLFSDTGGDEYKERLEMGVSPRVFRLGCTPIVNLFPKTAEPILIDQRRYEYPVVPDARRPNATEVFSVDDVASIDPATQRIVQFRPFYSFRHSASGDTPQCFWLARRRPSPRVNDEGTDMFLSLVDMSLRPVRPGTETLSIHTTCTNRDLPARLPSGNEELGDFELEGVSSIKRIVALRKPTKPLRIATGKSRLWRLISHLSLNYLSLVEEGTEALKQILRLYDFGQTASSAKEIEGIAALRSYRHFAPVISDGRTSFARGTRVEMELDEEQFIGGGVYLFASVLEQFFGLYASLNSFSQLVVRTRQRKEVLREWPPRAGRKILI